MEIGLDHPIEVVLLLGLQGLGLSVIVQRRLALIEDAVDEQRVKGDVIEMGMSKEDMAYARHLVQ